MSPTPKPRLLLTNDDGIRAIGIQALADALDAEFELLIVAPSHERSGAGHSVTVLKDLKLERFARKDVHWGWSFQGTPADCVKIALTHMTDDRPIDMVVSGINLGQNLGINILYSGTVAAAREAALLGLPSIAFSLGFRDLRKVDFPNAARIALDVTRKVIQRGMPPGVLLNVNIPPCPAAEIEGFAVTRQGTSGFLDRFEKTEIDELSAMYRNVGAKFAPSANPDVDLDDHAVRRKMVSITPLQADQTAHQFLRAFADLEGPWSPPAPVEDLSS